MSLSSLSAETCTRRTSPGLPDFLGAGFFSSFLGAAFSSFLLLLLLLLELFLLFAEDLLLLAAAFDGPASESDSVAQYSSSTSSRSTEAPKSVSRTCSETKRYVLLL